MLVPKNILGSKKIWVKKKFVSKNSGPKNNLGTKKDFRSKKDFGKDFGSEKNFGLKNFWVRNFFGGSLSHL